MRTPATLALDEAGIDYRVTEYELATDETFYGDALVEVLDLDPDTVGKTLVVSLDDGRHVVAVVPVSATLDLKRLARAARSKRASMANRETAERLTGSTVGGISPLGLRHALDVYIDELLVVAEEVHVSAGRRGLEVSLSPADLVVAAHATVVDLAR